MGRWLRWLGGGTLLLGAVLVGAAVASGEAELALVVFLPVIYGGGLLLGAGIACLIAGFVLWFFGLGIEPVRAPPEPIVPAAAPPPAERAARRFGGVVFLGPFPIAFGSDQRAAFWALVGGAVLLALILVFVTAGFFL